MGFPRVDGCDYEAAGRAVTVPRLLVVGADRVADPVLVEATVQHAYLTLRQESGSTPILVTMNRTHAEAVAERWWRARGMLVDYPKPFKDKYLHVNSLLSDVPDLVLVFGSDKLTERAVEGARRGQIRVVQITENEDAK